MLNQQFIVRDSFGTITAGAATRTIRWFVAPRKLRVTNAYVLVSTDVAVDASDYAQIQIQNASSNNIASLLTNATALDNDTANAMTISGAYRVINSGDVVRLVLTQNGSTGVALTELTVQLVADPVE